MCGVVGVIPVNHVNRPVDDDILLEVCLMMHNELLNQTITRGKDATGIVVSFYGVEDEDAPEAKRKPWWGVLKQPDSADVFLSNDDKSKTYDKQDPRANIWDFTKRITQLNQRRNFNYILGHCRAATVGTVYNPHNNHPIIVDNVIGIHNGSLKNDNALFDKYKFNRIGQVDTEIIFQLLAQEANDRALEAKDFIRVADHIDGAFATIGFNAMHPETIGFMRNSDRPLVSAYSAELGILFLYSEEKFMDSARSAYDRMRLVWRGRLPDLGHLEVKSVPAHTGAIVDITTDYDFNSGLNDVLNSFKIPTMCKTEHYRYSAASNYGSSSSIYQGNAASSYNAAADNAVKSPADNLPFNSKPAQLPASTSTVVTTPATLPAVVTKTEPKVDNKVNDHTDYDKEVAWEGEATVETVEEDPNAELVRMAEALLIELTTKPGLSKSSKDTEYAKNFFPSIPMEEKTARLKQIYETTVPPVSAANAMHMYEQFFTEGFIAAFHKTAQEMRNITKEIETLKGSNRKIDNERKRLGKVVGQLKYALTAILARYNQLEVNEKSKKLQISAELKEFFEANQKTFGQIRIDTVAKILATNNKAEEFLLYKKENENKAN